MGQLTDEEKVKYLLGHGKLFEWMCDEKDCGKLIQVSECPIVLKWGKRPKGSPFFLGSIALEVRCHDCQRRLHPPKEEIKIKGTGKGIKFSAELAKGLKINPIVSKVILKLLRTTEGGLPLKDLLIRLRRKKVIRELKKKEIAATLRGLKKLKLIRKRAGNIQITPAKKEKKSKKSKEKVA